MYKTGFREFKLKYFDINVKLAFNDALVELEGWDLDEEFFSNYYNDLKEYGLEYPLIHMIYCRK